MRPLKGLYRALHVNVSCVHFHNEVRSLALLCGALARLCTVGMLKARTFRVDVSLEPQSGVPGPGLF